MKLRSLAGSKVFYEVGKLKNLESSDVKDEAAKVREEVDRLDAAIQRLFDKLNDEGRMIERVKDGVMKGANNPLIRARLEYGKEMHIRLQSSFSCDEKEVVLSSGKPDCIKFDAGACKVIEFKPDTLSRSEAEDQAKRYLGDVRARYRNDDRAKNCKWTSEGPVFDAVGELYTACRVP